MIALAALLALPQPAPACGPERAPTLPPPPPITAVAGMTKPPSRANNRGIIVRIPDAAPSIALPPIAGPRDKNRPLVVIDAGHGGHDPGTRNAELGWQEKDVTLAIAKAIRAELLRGGRIRVAMTRDDDRYLVLQERYGIARKMGARLFISIHADAAEDDAARGATVYTLSEVASDREAARLAARENRADILGGVDLSQQSSAVTSILIDLTQRETMAASTRFADLLKREGENLLPFRKPAHRFASLIVLKAPDVPSILFETGYLTNKQEAERLASPEGQAGIARSVARAAALYFAREEPRP